MVRGGLLLPKIVYMFIYSMQHLYYSLIMLFTGLGLISFVDIVGPIISRKLNFNYGYFTILSFIAYVAIAYLIAKETNRALLTWVVSILIGFYDGTVGWLIAQKLKAKYKYSKNAAEKITIAHTVLAATLFSTLCGFIGYYLGTR
ncbi:MAG TPA: hypothetical protein VJU78_14195 [Chitinophagaceae bacterium]|nr:hypothetical protein [Chitinophagaceae bacterium]